MNYFFLLLLLLNHMPSDITNGHGLKNHFYDIFFYNNEITDGYRHEDTSLGGEMRISAAD